MLEQGLDRHAAVASPWSPQAKGRRLKQIQRVLDDLPDDEVAVYDDEIDIDLNPKIGLDWMVPGQQKQVSTPGDNVKRYMAGAMDVRTQELAWVEWDRRSSDLFIGLLWALPQAYPDAKVIHMILDNYRIHSSDRTELALEGLQGRVVLHFLPPYCPEHNKIERYWEDLHAAVTRNHRCGTMDELMERVRAFLRKRQRRTKSTHKTEHHVKREKHAAQGQDQCFRIAQGHLDNGERRVRWMAYHRGECCACQLPGECERRRRSGIPTRSLLCRLPGLGHAHQPLGGWHGIEV